MRLSAVAVLMILTTVFLSGCAQDKTAALDDRSGTYFGRLRTVTPTLARSPIFTPSFNDARMEADAAIPDVSSRDLAPPAPSAAPTILVKKKLNSDAPFLTQSLAAAPHGNAPWQWPVNGNVTQTFGKQGNGIANEGITIATTEGAPIRAAAAGEVAFVGNNVRDYGNIVILRHAGGAMTSYAHAQTIIVKKGQPVRAGSVVGYVGQSGRAKTPQLHFAMRTGDRAIDPLSKLPRQVAAN